MNPNNRLPIFMLTFVATIALSACTAPAVESPEVPVAASDAPIAEPTASPTANPRDDDAVMFVRATVTADNGSQLDLEMQVHQAYAFDYGGTGTLPAGVIEDCQGLVTEPMIAEGQWSFVRANVSALAVESTPAWPAGESVTVSPSGQFAYSAARGMITADPANTDELCRQDKFFSGAGNGAIAAAITGDAIALTGWTNHTFGFRAMDLVFSNCTIEVTDVGRQFGAEKEGWTIFSDATTCAAGAATERNEY